PSCLRDDQVVFRPGAELAGDEDARLDGERHVRLERGLVDDVEVRSLVHVLADRVTQTVAEVLAEPGAGDDLTRRRIDVARAGARPQCLRAGFLRGDYGVIGLPESRGRLTDVDRAT